MDVRLPDGTIIQGVPDGTTRADLVTKLKSNGMAVPSDWLQAAPAPEAVRSTGSSLNRAIADVPRQLGLTARYALEGPAQAAQIFTEPVAGLMRAAGAPTKSLGEVASGFANWLGLPRPESPMERVVGDASRVLAGGGGMLGASRAVSQLPGAVGAIGQAMSTNPASQLTSAVGAGGLGGLSKEGGGNEATQAAAALIGGVGGAFVPSAMNGAMNAARSLNNRFTMTPQQMDLRIASTLERAGVDYSTIPDNVRRGLRVEAEQALRTGREMSPDALRRLADFKAVGVTPTRGAITQDPVQITREMNLAKMGANATDEGLQGLAQIQNRNNARLIGVMNEAGAARGDAFNAGADVINSIRSNDEALARGVSDLYQAARDTSGRSAKLNGYEFTQKANQMLDEGLLGGALPKDVADHLNRIARGEVPFDVNYAEQLKTRIGNLQRATSDGSARMALGTVRRALDDTSLMGAESINPGSLPAVPGTIPQSPTILGQESIDAFNKARSAARSRFAWQESGRPVEAALGGAEPDKFIQKFILNGSLSDAQAVASNAPQAMVKDAILGHLKEKAVNGAADEVAKFSQSAYNKALNQIGDRKLSLFFSPQEVEQLRQVGRVASYLQAQPVGSAVNNSNSGALLLGRGLDFLNKIPGGQAFIGQPIQNIQIGMRQSAAKNLTPGLLAPQASEPIVPALLAPAAVVSGGLLAPY